jgi:hypothetical protein
MNPNLTFRAARASIDVGKLFDFSKSPASNLTAANSTAAKSAASAGVDNMVSDAISLSSLEIASVSELWVICLPLGLLSGLLLFFYTGTNPAVVELDKHALEMNKDGLNFVPKGFKSPYKPRFRKEFLIPNQFIKTTFIRDLALKDPNSSQKQIYEDLKHFRKRLIHLTGWMFQLNFSLLYLPVFSILSARIIQYSIQYTIFYFSTVPVMKQYFLPIISHKLFCGYTRVLLTLWFGFLAVNFSQKILLNGYLVIYHIIIWVGNKSYIFIIKIDKFLRFPKNKNELTRTEFSNHL